jgi:hypothetical protein
MWVDPDSGKTWEQVCETVWRRLRPATQARFVALEAASGKTREELMAEAVDEANDRLEGDPQCRQRYDERLEHEQYPFGRDPRLRKESSHD